MVLLENLTKIFFKENIWQTLLILFLTCFISFLKINIISYITANIIKSVENKNFKLVFNYYKYFIYISVLYIFIYIITKFTQNNLLTKLRLWIKKKIVNSIMKNNIEEYNDINFSKLNIPIQRSSNLLYFLWQNIISKFIPEISIIIVISCFFIYKNLLFGSIFLIGNIIFFIYFFWVIKKFIKKNLIFETSMHNNELILTEILNNIDKIIFRGNHTDEINKFSNNIDHVKNIHSNYYNNLIKEIFIINGLLFGLIFILIYFIIYLFIKKQIDITIFITFFTMILLYRDSILTPVKEIPEYIDFFAKFENLNNILGHIKLDDKNIIKNNNVNFDSIKFENINFKYKKSNKNILNNFNINLKINNNIIGIIGKSGSGKSTVLKLLLNIYKYNGNIYIDNVNTRDLDNEYIRKNILYVNQNAKLFDKNIKDNIFYGCNDTEESQKFFNEIMKFDNIRKMFEKFDYDKNVGFSGENLSGGQRQIINIINGLIASAKIVILDEPTNALDSILKKDIINLIKYFKKYKKCIIIVSHDKDIFTIFDETIEIK